MSLRLPALAGIALTIGACASQPVPVPAAPAVAAPSVLRVIPLKNAGFEEPATARACPTGWDCTMHANPQAFRFFLDGSAPASGKASLCIEPSSPEPWGLASQGVFDIAALRGARVRFSAAIRLEGVTGDGAGPYVMARGVALAHDKRLLTGTHGWQRIAVEIEVPAGAPFIELGVALEGRGRVCLDDALLEVVQAPKSPV